MDDDLKKIINEVLDDYFKSNPAIKLETQPPPKEEQEEST